MATKMEVEKLIEKSAAATTSHEAMQYAQAALNAAHARQVVNETAKRA